MSLGKLFSLVVTGFLLTACGGGGGGGDSSGNPTPQPAEQFTVSTSVGTGGSISPTSATVESGGTATFTITPASGNEIGSATGCNGSLTGNQYTTGAVSANCEVSVTFQITSSSGTDTQAPAASITFPMSVSRTSANSIIVKGVASDAGAIQAIRVNGVEATITRKSGAIAQGWTSILRSSGPIAPLSNGENSDGSESDEDEVEWQAEVPVPEDEDSDLVVETEDNAGNVDQAADTAKIVNRVVPTTFEIDNVTRKLVGVAWHGLYATWGLDDDSYQSISVENPPYCHSFAIKPGQDEIICSSVFDNQLSIDSVSLASGEKQHLLAYNLNLDPADWSWANVWETEVSHDGTTLYMLMYYVSAHDWNQNKSVILTYDFASSTISMLADGAAQSGATVRTGTFTLSNDGLVHFNGFWGDSERGDDSLSILDYAGSDVQSLSSPFDLLGGGIALSEDNIAAYVVGYDGIASSNLTDGTRKMLSLESDERLWNIAQLESVGLDEPNNRLLVGDTGFGYLFSVDIETGDRTEFASNGVGAGKHVHTPRTIELDEANNRAFVLDDGGNSREVLFEIDLSSGDRTVIADFGLTCSRIAQDLLLDTTSNRAFAVFDHAIYEVSLDQRDFKPLFPNPSPNDCAESPYFFTGASLDLTGNRLLVTETMTDAIVSIDLATGTLTTLYSSPDIDVPMDVEQSADQSILYIASQANGDLHSYDPATGELQLLLDSCPDDSESDLLSVDRGGISGIYLDPSQQSIWIMAGLLLRYDLETKVCSSMPWKSYGYGLNDNTGILDIAITSSRQMIGTRFRHVVQIDFETGEMVTISR